MKAKRRGTTPDSVPRVTILVEDARWRTAGRNLPGQIRKAASAAVARAGAAKTGGGRITVLLTGDERLRALNAQFRKKDKPTNVLSFPAAVSGYLGDVAIAYGATSREAKSDGKTLAGHVLHLTVHGVLHLLGYDHEKAREAEIMEGLETDILAELGIPDPYARRKRAA